MQIDALAVIAIAFCYLDKNALRDEVSTLQVTGMQGNKQVMK